MTHDPTLIADLARAGLDPELIQRVANLQATALAAEQDQLAMRQSRANGAERVRRHRERQRCNVTVTPSNVTSSEINDLAAQPSRARNPYLLPLVANEVRKKERKEEARGRALPPDWKPNQGHYDEAQEHGYAIAWVNRQAEDMRLWAEANSNRSVARKANWDKTFTGWIRREMRKGKTQNGVRQNSCSAVAQRIYFEELEREKRERDQRAVGVLLPFGGR